MERKLKNIQTFEQWHTVMIHTPLDQDGFDMLFKKHCTQFIMNSMNPGILWANERQIFDEIYEYLLRALKSKKS